MCVYVSVMVSVQSCSTCKCVVLCFVLPRVKGVCVVCKDSVTCNDVCVLYCVLCVLCVKRVVVCVVVCSMCVVFV